MKVVASEERNRMQGKVIFFVTSLVELFDFTCTKVVIKIKTNLKQEWINEWIKEVSKPSSLAKKILWWWVKREQNPSKTSKPSGRGIRSDVKEWRPLFGQVIGFVGKRKRRSTTTGYQFHLQDVSLLYSLLSSSLLAIPIKAISITLLGDHKPPALVPSNPLSTQQPDSPF